MQYFTQDFLDFFNELSRNNERDWFHANKKRYEKSVKEPFKAFVTDVIAAVGKVDPEVSIEAKDAIFRINRDIRFSKDKSPYKLHSSAVVSKYGRRDQTHPGLYLSLSHQYMHVGGGCYMPPKEELWRLRDSIARDPKAFRKTIEGEAFKDYFGGIQGDKNKVLPKEFKEAAASEPYIFNKQFYYMGDFSPTDILSNTLVDDVMKMHKAAQPYQRWMLESMAD